MQPNSIATLGALPTSARVHPADLQVGSVMARPVLRVAEDDELEVADAALALARSHHVPVTHGRRLVGVIADRDLLRVRRGDSLHARDIMSKEPHVIGPDASLAVAAQRMLAHRVSCLPVVDHGELVGIVTTYDCLRVTLEYLRGLEREGAPPLSVRALIGQRPASKVLLDEQLDLATLLIHHAHTSQLPVVSGDAVVGLISDRQVLRTLAGADELAESLWRGHAVRAGALMTAPTFVQADSRAVAAGDRLRRRRPDRRAGLRHLCTEQPLEGWRTDAWQRGGDHYCERYPSVGAMAWLRWNLQREGLGGHEGAQPG